MRRARRDPRAKPRALRIAAGAVLLQQRRHLADARRRVSGHRAGARVCRRRHGAVPVRGHDARHRHDAVSQAVRRLLAARGRGRRLRRVRDRQRDRGEAPGRREFQDGAAVAGRLFQYPSLGNGVVHPLRISRAAGGSHPAGGQHRGHHSDAAAAHRPQAAGHRAASGVRAKDRVRIVKMASEKRS